MITDHVLANTKAAQAASGPARRAILVSLSPFRPAAARSTPRGAPMQ
ncbi:hypothetical protein [Massilia litorea]|uniref:Uncharacterized protein n=1 Tax=Massilia litorea TaxID=2769491 RepID=A0A7L9U0X2_9BURK|nr:hypothetical protein [Massilia litorea]QOL48600.1 hypothetical protein LPB04_16740 [Massilia litorea]